MTRTITTTYQPVRARRSLIGACSVCGKTTRRSRTFEHTVNPFNKNADGVPKSYDEVRAAVNAVADAWQPDFRHGACRG